MKLMRMTAFVQYVNEKYANETITDSTSTTLRDALIYLYMKLLTRTINLGMFIPCDLDGNPLSEPMYYYRFTMGGGREFCNDYDKCVEYQEAKDRLIFKDFEVDGMHLECGDMSLEIRAIKEFKYTIEDVLAYGEPMLTENACEDFNHLMEMYGE